MADTTHLQLPLLAAAQAQRHVTHNEALLRLDALVQLAVIDRDLTAPPAIPSDGDRYIPASGATGAWADWDWNIAWFVDGVWTKLVPREGWRVWIEDEDVLLVWDGAAWRLSAREQLFAARTYHVNASGGSDANDGLTNGTAFATIQKAIDVVAAIDTSIYSVTIQLADGTYAENLFLRPLTGAGIATIKGNEASPPNVLLAPASDTGPSGFSSAIHTENSAQWVLDSFKIERASGTNQEAIRADNAVLRFGNLDFGAGFSLCHLNSLLGAKIWGHASFTISGNVPRFAFCRQGSQYLQTGGVVATLTGTPAFSTAFVDVAEASVVFVSGSYSGSATGKRYNGISNGVIRSANGAADFFPGDVAGTTASGGVYV